MDNQTLMELTADVVSAHVGHNRVEPGELPRLIQVVYDALAGAGQSAPEPAEPLKPAVSVRSSVKPDAVTCLECGQSMKMLKRHLKTDHDLSPSDYRARWALPTSYPMVAPSYSEKRSQLAQTIGLGRKRRGNAGDPETKGAPDEVLAAADAE
jgi:predicted transcriptional regulator